MQILRIRSTVVILTKYDEIPLAKIATPTYTKLFVKRYNFTNFEINQIANLRLTLAFQLGLFQTEDEEIVITNLEIEERKIIINVEGDKRAASLLVDDLMGLLSELADSANEDLLTPIIEANESELVVKLDFNINSVISPNYLALVEKDVKPELGLGNSTTQIRPASIRFEVEYLPDDFNLQDNKIALTRKEMILQRRPGYPLEENVFVSKLPANSDVHIKLLEKIEALFSG